MKVDQTKPVSRKPENHKTNIDIEADNETKVFSFLTPPRSQEDENENEIGVELDLESVMSDSFISVGNYRVRSGSSTILNAIISKHGDIAQNCTLESDSMRSRYLDCLCSLMLELKSTPVNELTKVKVKEMVAVVKDLESVNIEVAWLGSVLEEFGKFQEDVESEKEMREGLVKGKREELEGEEAKLARMEEDVVVARLRVEEIRARIVEMEKIGFGIEKFKGKLFLDELL